MGNSMADMGNTGNKKLMEYTASPVQRLKEHHYNYMTISTSGHSPTCSLTQPFPLQMNAVVCTIKPSQNVVLQSIHEKQPRIMTCLKA